MILNVLGDVDSTNVQDVILVENWATHYALRNSTWDEMVDSANRNLAAHISRNLNSNKVENGN